MHDMGTFRANLDMIAERLSARGFTLPVEQYRELDARRRAAITESDNAAAESIWEGLGDPVTAARKVEDVLKEAGDSTTVQSQKVRPEFTAFGQTYWPLIDQARFLAFAVCDNRNAPSSSLFDSEFPVT